MGADMRNLFFRCTDVTDPMVQQPASSLINVLCLCQPKETRLVLNSEPCHVMFGHADLGCRLIEPHGTDAAQKNHPAINLVVVLIYRKPPFANIRESTPKVMQLL